MKKIISIMLVLASIVFLFTGCEKIVLPDIEAERMCEKIIKYFDENDTESLKAMFCDKILETEDIDEQIQAGMDFLEGKMVSYHFAIGSGGGGTRDGETLYIRISPGIDKIKTDANKSYEIIFYSYLVNAEDTNKEGISEITIISENDEKCKIGDFYYVNPEYK